MYKFPILIGIIMILALFCMSAVSEPTKREQHYAKQLKKSLATQNTVLLGEKNNEFLAIFLEAEISQPKGGVLILHDVGTHLDWQAVIHPLRTQLPTNGWNTMAIMLPVYKGLDQKDIKNAEVESLRRIEVALAYFTQHNIYNLVIIGYGYGAAMASSFAVSYNGENSPRAIVLISAFNPLWSVINQQVIDRISKQPFPVLDIVGAREITEALQNAALRGKAAKKSGNDNYQQISIIGSDHSYSQAENTLLNRITKWINKKAPSMELKIKNQAPESNSAPPQS